MHDYAAVCVLGTNNKASILCRITMNMVVTYHVNNAGPALVSCADTPCGHRRIRDALILADDYIGDEWVQFILPGSVDVADTKKSVHRRHRKVLAILPIHTA